MDFKADILEDEILDTFGGEVLGFAKWSKAASYRSRRPKTLSLKPNRYVVAIAVSIIPHLSL
ncbi:MAG: hypothetical protein MR215_09665 [Bacteroidales bacterium]|nr:hypothetical protein [Bacteroidales bacterium]MDD7724780.1 hypothetical protein [Bacteroidales bacterium]MDY4174310.1 hypothetical protein [Bacteroidales bacterium]